MLWVARGTLHCESTSPSSLALNVAVTMVMEKEELSTALPQPHGGTLGSGGV